ncbi:interleukin-21 [Brachyhypopomus gauderio]|uniref:interleukin-21 n=1 Tax=Brachyhypopomus gauderio TaxID=698409 RepID=UPI004041646D
MSQPSSGFLCPEGSYIKQNDSLFYSPTNDIEDCCSQSALQCFHSQLLNISSISSKHLKIKLWKNLKKNNIVTSVDNCSQEERDNVTCKSCDSYLMVNSKEFLKNLLSLLQKSFSKLP